LFKQASLGAAFMPLRFGRLRLGAVAQYDIGIDDAEARGIPASLSMHRVSGGPYAHIVLTDRWRLTSRIMPGATYMHASLADPGASLVSKRWTWSLETSVGAAFRLGGVGRAIPKASFWLIADLGYTFAGTTAMRFEADLEDDDPRKFGAIELPPLSPSGFSQRLAFAVSF
jgi:hypothetical protein